VLGCSVGGGGTTGDVGSSSRVIGGSGTSGLSEEPGFGMCNGVAGSIVFCDDCSDNDFILTANQKMSAINPMLKR
jgi:hypothetical protein